MSGRLLVPRCGERASRRGEPAQNPPESEETGGGVDGANRRRGRGRCDLPHVRALSMQKMLVNFPHKRPVRQMSLLVQRKDHISTRPPHSRFLMGCLRIPPGVCPSPSPLLCHLVRNNSWVFPALEASWSPVVCSTPPLSLTIDEVLE